MSLETIRYEQLRLRPGERVLDLGCGEGRHAITAYLSERVHVIGLDLSERDLTTASERFTDFELAGDEERSLTFMRASGLELPFADASFDKVICAEVLEHIPDYRAMVAEIRRVLKPGGSLAVSVPRFWPEWVCWRLSDAYHEVEGGHVRIFRTSELRGALEGASMRRYGWHWAHGLHSPYWWLRCLFWARGEQVWPVKLYHRLLVWDLMKKPAVTRWLEKLFDPLWGKSIVMYFVRDNS